MSRRKPTNEDVTRKDVKTFMHGWCHILAHEIHESTGWPMHAFFSEDSLDPLIHAFIVTPMGEMLDVRGVQTPAAFDQRWEQYFIKEYGDGEWLRREETNWHDLETIWEKPKSDGVRKRAKKLAAVLIRETKKTIA
jgi:hypothetical protein